MGIPYTRPGRHRRIRLQDMLAYMRKHDEERERLLTELVEEALTRGPLRGRLHGAL